MGYREIDLTSYPRKDHFVYFNTMVDPTAGVTVKMDCTSFLEMCREKHVSFYMAFIHAAVLAANTVPQLRQRIHEGKIIEYDTCNSSHIELLEDGTYCYCTLHHDMAWDEYFVHAAKAREAARAAHTIEEDEDVESLYFVTTLPWLHYEQIIMPVKSCPGSNPNFCWGRYIQEPSGKWVIPVTLCANHALVDGMHFAQFFAALEKILKMK